MNYILLCTHFTPGETENEWQKTKQVPILLLRGARSFFDAKKMKKKYFASLDFGDNPIYLISNPDGQDWEVKLIIKSAKYGLSYSLKRDPRSISKITFCANWGMCLHACDLQTIDKILMQVWHAILFRMLGNQSATRSVLPLCKSTYFLTFCLLMFTQK